MICQMTKPQALGWFLSLLAGWAVFWSDSAIAHNVEGGLPHSHRDWRPLIVVGIGLFLLFFGFWIYRRRQSRQQPTAFVPPVLDLPQDEGGD